MNRLVAVLLLFAVGCQKEPAKPTHPSSPDLLTQLQANAKKNADANRKAQADLEKQLESIKNDPQPMFDMALTSVKETLAKYEGDDALSTASISVDPSTLKTFGPEKWKVRGPLKFTDEKKRERQTTWEVTLEVIFDKIQVRQIRLDVK